MNYADRLHDAVERCGNPCLVGIDPHLDLLPAEYARARDASASLEERAQYVEEFCLELVDVAAGRVAAVKPQSAFFEQLGAHGARVWERVVDAARDAGLLVIGDVKRSDIASTARAYATAHLEGLPGASRSGLCDAITINPYLGEDAVTPFLEACQRADTGLYVLVRTSNAGSGLFQEHGDPSLAQRVGEAVSRWGSSLRGTHGWSSVGAVVGATHGAEVLRLREAMPHTPFLLPGFGAQGAGAADILAAFPQGLHGGLVATSRGVAFAWREAPDRPWKDASVTALDATIEAVVSALSAPR